MDGPWPALYGGEGGGHGYACIPCTLKIRSGCEGGGKGAIADDCEGECVTNTFQNTGRGWWNESGVGTTLRTPCGGDSTLANVVVQTVDGNILDDQGAQQITVRTDGKAPTLRAETHGNLPAVMEPVTIEPGIAAREGGHIYEGVCGTLRANAGDNQMAVAYAAGFKAGQGAQARSIGWENEKSPTLAAEAGGNSVPSVCIKECLPFDTTQVTSPQNGGQSLNFSGAVRVQYIVRRLTPTECARLQGFSDDWGHPDPKDDFTDEEYRFWLDVRNTHAAINGKVVKEYTEHQMLTWYNKLHTDSAEYKMWGNGIALPPALYCMQGIASALMEQELGGNQ